MGVRTSQSRYIWDEIIGRGKSRHKDSTGEWKRARAGWSTGEHGGSHTGPADQVMEPDLVRSWGHAGSLCFTLNAKGSTASE